MKRFAYPFAILVVAATAFNASAGSTTPVEADLAEKKQLRALSRLEVKRAFDLAAKERGGQAIEISCAPADSDWCADGFVAACDKNGGGMSTDPDGGVTCSLPQLK